MENVQRECGHESIAKGVLLIEVSGNGAGLFVPPCSPLVNEQSDASLGVFLVHDGLVLLDYFLNLQTFAQRPVVLVVVEVDGRAFRAVPTRAGVIMQTDTLHAVANLFHQHFGPVVIIVACT